MIIIKKNTYINKYTVIYKDIVLQGNDLDFVLSEMFLFV